MKNFLVFAFVNLLILGLHSISLPKDEKSYVKRTEFVIVEDTLKLATDVYLPKSDGQYPCILIRTPYNKDGAKGDAEYFTSNDYAVVVQDTRGKFKSDGVFYPFRYDRHDGLATVDWIKVQTWCNGKIGGWGGSYLGYTQWAIADRLDAMTPFVTTANMFDALYVNGLFSLATAFNWGLVVDSKTVNAIKPEKILASYNILPLSVADDSTYGPNQFMDDWLIHQNFDSYWGAMNHREPTSSATLSLAGWYDIFLMPQIVDFEAILQPGHPDNRLVIGPWAHGKIAADIDFGDQSKPNSGIAMMRRFLNRHLKSDPTPVIQEPFKDNRYNLFIMQRNEWYGCNHWPPEKSVMTHYYFGSDQSLSTSISGDGQVKFDVDPLDPYPNRGGTFLGVGVGPAWQGDNVSRSDQVAFKGEELRSPLTLLGPINATLYVSTTAPCTDFILCLQDVYPDGKILNIQEGCTTTYTDASSSPRVQKLRVSVWATGYELKIGHSIRVVITSSWFPRFNRNLNTGEPIFSAKEMRVAAQQVYFGPTRPSHITLPILEVN